MSYGIRAWDANGNLTFDSSTDLTLFSIYSQAIAGASVNRGSGLTISFPAYPGRQITAFMQSPYNNGSTDKWAVLSCRVSYPGSVPTVLIFVDNGTASLPICDGWLTVMLTGGSA
jgi:hypothetical protein